MKEMVEERMSIDVALRFAFFGLECSLGVPFSVAECERVFRDSEHDQVSQKQYVFHESSRLTVTGCVDEYEPEEIRIRIEGDRGCSDVLRRVVQGAKAQALRLRRMSQGRREE